MNADDFSDEPNDQIGTGEPIPRNHTHADAERLARILGVTARHVRRLAMKGILRPEPDGLFPIMASIDIMVAAAAPKPSPSDAGKQRMIDFLGRKLDREREQFIPRDELAATLNTVVGMMSEALREIPAMIGGSSEEQQRVQAIVDDAVARFETKAAETKSEVMAR